MTTFEKICSDSWRPYGANYKKIFDSLKKENFRPYDFNIKEVRIHDYSRAGSPEVDGICASYCVIHAKLLTMVHHFPSVFLPSYYFTNFNPFGPLSPLCKLLCHNTELC